MLLTFPGWLFIFFQNEKKNWMENMLFIWSSSWLSVRCETATPQMEDTRWRTTLHYTVTVLLRNGSGKHSVTEKKEGNVNNMVFFFLFSVKTLSKGNDIQFELTTFLYFLFYLIYGFKYLNSTICYLYIIQFFM